MGEGVLERMTVIRSKFIFCHVPKTGGTSVMQALGGLTRDIPNHVPSQCLAHHGAPIFGTIRNPWARMASLYEFIAHKGQDPQDRVDWIWMREVGFKRWLMEGAQFLASDPVDGRWYDRTHSGREKIDRYRWQHEKSFDGQRRYMENGLPPLQQRPCMWWHAETDHLIRTESLQADLDELLPRLGAPRVALKHANKTNRKTRDWRSLYDAESVAFVARWHAADIEAGGYTFENDAGAK